MSLSEVTSKINRRSLVDATTKEAANSLIIKDNKIGRYVWQAGLDGDKDGTVNIDKVLKPRLVNIFESLAPFPAGKCTSLEPCLTWIKSVLALQPNLSIISNLSSTNILILNGENDSQTPIYILFYF